MGRPASEVETRLRHLANSTPGVAYQFRARDRGDYECLFVSRHAEGMLGLSPVPDAFLDRVVEQVPADYREEMVDVLESAVEAEDRFNIRVPFDKPSGGQIWIRNAAVPERIEDEVVFSGLLQEVTHRRNLEQEVVAMSDKERRRIGEELHDMLASKLAGTVMALRSVAVSVEEGEVEDAPELLSDVIDRIKECVDESRRLSRSLAPLDVQHGTLVDGLRGLVEQHNQIQGLSCFSSIEEDIDPPEDVADELYRIGSEAVHNVVRHAEADHLDLFLETRDDRIVLIVEDDGEGFRTDEVSDKHGLHLMQYRADLIGAHLKITSAEEEGTRVRCALPRSKIPEAEGT